MKNCIKCKQPIQENTTKGRNKSYCSEACRRASELEIRRINGRLVVLERITESYRLKVPVMPLQGEEEEILAEIELQEKRLRELFSGEDAIS